MSVATISIGKSVKILGSLWWPQKFFSLKNDKREMLEKLKETVGT